MAELDCAELCLPSEFLAEDIFLEKKKAGEGVGDGAADGDGDSCFPSEFPYDWVYVSDVDTKGESLAGVESKDEDEKVVSSPLVLDDPWATRVVGSPQSTLCAAANWNLSSREASEVLSLQQKQASRGLLCPPVGKPFSPLAAGLTKNAAPTGYHAHPSLSQHKDLVAQIQQLKRQHMAQLQVAAPWRRHNRAKGGGGLAGSKPARPPGSPRASWTPHLQQAGSGMRAVFLGAGSNRETGGTGVFLPRRVGSPTEPRKKPALSTVLLPARVMQALNLNLDESAAQPRSPGGFVLHHDAIRARNSAMMSQRRSYRSQPVHAGHHQHEVCLPSEWTY